MSKLEQARKTWVGKSDEWLYERLANELSDKVQEIHRLLKELDEVKNLTIPAVVGRSEQLPCDCNVKLAETTLQVYCPKCYKTHKMK